MNNKIMNIIDESKGVVTTQLEVADFKQESNTPTFWVICKRAGVNSKGETK